MKTLAPALLALLACKHAREPAEETEPPAVRVTCVAATSTTLTGVLVLRGAIAPPPRAQAVVAAPVPGRLVRLLVDEGDVVVANQLVATMEDPSLGASAAAGAAEVAAIAAELRAATAERARREKLVGQGIAPQKDLDEARAREEAAQANVAAAQARGQLARRQLARTDLRAPRGGTVLRVFKRAGELVDGADATILELADLSVLELQAEVTGAELPGLALHAGATVRLDAMPAITLTGEIVAIGPAVDPVTTLGTVRIALRPGARPAVGLAGRAEIARAARPAITIPAVATRRSLTGADEVVICAGDHAEIRGVELGVHRGAAVEVTAGLGAGDRVVIDHVLGLEDDAPIEIAPAPAGAPR